MDGGFHKARPGHRLVAFDLGLFFRLNSTNHRTPILVTPGYRLNGAKETCAPTKERLMSGPNSLACIARTSRDNENE
jgi:hypothetical protein